MKIVVFLKRVPDTGIPVQVNETGNDIVRENLNYVVNPYDEFAIEEALRIKEKVGDAEIVAVSLGDDGAKETLRNALALGADRAVHLKVPTTAFVPPDVTAKAFHQFLSQEGFDLVLMGKEAVDDNFGVVPAYLATLAGVPLLTYVVQLEIGDGKVKVHRETDDGAVEVEAPMPCILTTEKGLNEPRLPTLRGIMMAKRKPIDEVEVTLSDSTLGLDHMEMPPKKEAGVVIQDEFPKNVERLLEILREKKVL